MNLIIHTDGGSRGNPGEGAVGVVIEKFESLNSKSQTKQTQLVLEFGKRVGVVTNNEAEYLAVIEALKTVTNYELRIINIQFFLDSKLVCEQLSGHWKIKEERLKQLFSQVKVLEMEVGVPVSYSHVLRDNNKRADKLVNQALDSLE